MLMAREKKKEKNKQSKWQHGERIRISPADITGGRKNREKQERMATGRASAAYWIEKDGWGKRVFIKKEGCERPGKEDDLSQTGVELN